MKPVKINEVYELEIVDISNRGYGIAKIDGFTIFVLGTLDGERVKIKITKLEKRFGFGEVLEIIRPSDKRISQLDEIKTQIGTMPLEFIDYEYQLELKRKYVIDLISKRIKIDHIDVPKTIGMRMPYHYRNKAQIPVREINGVLETGIFKSETNELIPVDDYYIQDVKIDEAINTLRDIFRDHGIKAYNPDNHTGLLRHIIVRKSYVNDDIMIQLVTLDKDIPNLEAIVIDIVTKIDHVVSVIQNINPDKTNVILGDKQILLFGEDKYYDELSGYKFAISSKSFYQVNPVQTEILYEKALLSAHISKDDVVIDAYSGIGTITLLASRYAKYVYGIEVLSDAIKMSEYNAELNNVDNVSFIEGKAEDIMQDMSDELNADILIVDPPRKGLNKNFIYASVKTNVDRIIYISCNPVTLARDLEVYDELGYNIQSIETVDMFPHTNHVETIVLLSHKNPQTSPPSL